MWRIIVEQLNLIIDKGKIGETYLVGIDNERNNFRSITDDSSTSWERKKRILNLLKTDQGTTLDMELMLINYMKSWDISRFILSLRKS